MSKEIRQMINKVNIDKIYFKGPSKEEILKRLEQSAKHKDAEFVNNNFINESNKSELISIDDTVIRGLTSSKDEAIFDIGIDTSILRDAEIDWYSLSDNEQKELAKKLLDNIISLEPEIRFINYSKLVNDCYEKFSMDRSVKESRSINPRAHLRNRGKVVFPAENKKVKDDKDHFPINDRDQARNAWARVNQYNRAPKWYDGSLSELKSKVKNMVKREYPSITINESLGGDIDFRIQSKYEQYFEGDIIVTDPCYFIQEDLWDKICNEWFKPENKKNDLFNRGILLFEDGIKVLYSSTAFGDGTYHVNNLSGKSVHKNETGVDSGMIAVINVSDVQKLNPGFNIDDKFYPRINGFRGLVTSDGKGNFVGDIEVYTNDEIEEDDLYNYNEENECENVHEAFIF